MDIHGRQSRNSGTQEAGEGTRSIPEFLKDIGSGLQRIVRSEIQLAKIEMTDIAREAGSSALVLATGGILAVFALGFLLLTAMFGLNHVMPEWLSSLIIGVVLLIAGWIGIASAMARFRRIQLPRKTIETVKEDLRWMTDLTKS